jgi:hypothetical protein
LLNNSSWLVCKGTMESIWFGPFSRKNLAKLHTLFTYIELQLCSHRVLLGVVGSVIIWGHHVRSSEWLFTGRF